MMAERHPDELDLLDLVEGELPRAAQDSVAAHVDGCPQCAETVRRLRAGRGALHASGVLQLSERARDGITEAIDREPRARRLLPAFEGRRLGILVAVTLVVVASVLALAQWGGDVRLGGGGDEDSGDGGAEVAGQAEDDAGAGAGEERAVPESAGPVEPVRVAGPARDVAADLRAEGFDARVVDGEVIVRMDVRTLSGEQEADRLAAALAELPPGRVAVRVEP